MNDKDFEKLKKRIGKVVSKWSRPLGLRWWAVDLNFDREYAADDDKFGSNCHKGASCSVQWPYKTAQITFHLPALQFHSYYELERVVVHEFMHILINESRYFDEGICHEERVVSDLTSAVFWLEDKFNKKCKQCKGKK